MVTRKNIIDQKYALISVYNKSKLLYLCNNLKKHNFKFISTGSTAKQIKSLGHKCYEISKLTKFKEILDGRVKTLNPKIHGSILYDRENKNQFKEFKMLNTPKIDLVVVNLYPFESVIKTNIEEKIIDMIDIGGCSLLRSASKNYKYVTGISDTKDYSKLIENLNKNNGKTDISFRKKQAGLNYKITSRYDKIISKWFNKTDEKNNRINLRYGENPDQKAYIIEDRQESIFENQMSGKNISYNNILDVDSGYRCLQEFKEPTCIILKHTNPCGVSSSSNINKAFERAFKCDEKSAFGGVVLMNRKINIELANKLSKFFFEIIVATDFDRLALEKLKEKKKLVLLKINNLNYERTDYKSTIFGKLYKRYSLDLINKNFIKSVSKKKASEKIIKDLLFSLKVVKHLKSNAIVLSKDKQTIGLGIGQTNRVDSLKIAISNMKTNFKSKDFVCASDGFFPFTDSLKILLKHNCKCLGQPSGSINDEKIIKYASEKDLPIYFIKNRLFKH